MSSSSNDEEYLLLIVPLVVKHGGRSVCLTFSGFKKGLNFRVSIFFVFLILVITDMHGVGGWNEPARLRAGDLGRNLSSWTNRS